MCGSRCIICWAICLISLIIAHFERSLNIYEEKSLYFWRYCCNIITHFSCHLFSDTFHHITYSLSFSIASTIGYINSFIKPITSSTSTNTIAFFFFYKSIPLFLPNGIHKAILKELYLKKTSLLLSYIIILPHSTKQTLIVLSLQLF